MTSIDKRVVLHFPGFEPLDAKAHRARYERSAKQSAAVWDYLVETDPLQDFADAPYFDVRSQGASWSTASRIHVLDHDDLVQRLNGRNFFVRLAQGYLAAMQVAAGGGLTGYFHHAWRFGLFFIFPFLLMIGGLLIALLIAAAPHIAGLPLWSVAASIPLAAAAFVLGFLPVAARLHTMHLFSDWEMAVAMATLNGIGAEKWLESRAAGARRALAEPADEYVISSHSMGASVAVHVIGLLLERDPALFEGKRVVFATLGSAVLQCALLRSARVLRARVGLLARCTDIAWIDVHCLTDAIHFYKSKVAAICGHSDATQATIIFVRFKKMLSEPHYARIKRDFLRMHRQYVLGPDRRAPYDFTLMTAGPLPAASFAAFTHANMPQLTFGNDLS
jgi:hypothetical protein